jgi:dihydrofolate reductase
MSTVIANMSMSLDGYVADPRDDIEHLFGWYGNGPVVTPTADERWSFRTSEASAQRLRDALSTIGALVCGRRLFDLTQGWGGHHPMGVPVFVVTHQAPDDWAYPKAPFTFVTDGVASAVEQAKGAAGEKSVAVASANVAAQCLDAGLLDQVDIDLVPVLLGSGVPFFAHLTTAPVRFENPVVVQGDGVTHLSYRVRRPSARS